MPSFKSTSTSSWTAVRSLLSFAVAMLCLAQAGEAGAQAPAAAANNELGVAFNSVTLEVADVDAHVRFWTELGGTQRTSAGRSNGKAQPADVTFVDFPDMTIVIHKGNGSGASVGSVINHVGLQVPNTAQAVEKFKAAGLHVELGRLAGQAFITSPDDIRVEVLEDPALTIPVRGHHVHFFLPAPLDAQAWYARTFGATPGKRGNFDAADIAASSTVMNLSFSKAGSPTAATEGRTLDHIGFAVKSLDDFERRVRAQGVRVDEAKQQNGQARRAFLVDPWGTRIEVIGQDDT